MCQLSFSRLLTQTQREKSPQTGRTVTDAGARKKRKYKFLREITLEENIAHTENNFHLSSPQLAAKKEDSGKLFQCPKCDKNYKFASGLHYHTKHYH